MPAGRVYMVADDAGHVWVQLASLPAAIGYGDERYLRQWYEDKDGVPLDAVEAHWRQPKDLRRFVQSLSDEDGLYIRLTSMLTVIGGNRNPPADKRCAIEQLQHVALETLALELIRSKLEQPTLESRSHGRIVLPNAPARIAAVRDQGQIVQLAPGVEEDDASDSELVANDAALLLEWREHDPEQLMSPEGTPYGPTKYNERLSRTFSSYFGERAQHLPRQPAFLPSPIPSDPVRANILRFMTFANEDGSEHGDAAGQLLSLSPAGAAAAAAAAYMLAAAAELDGDPMSMSDGEEGDSDDELELLESRVVGKSSFAAREPLISGKELTLYASSLRRTSILRAVAQHLGHALIPVGGHGSRQKRLLLDVFGVAEPLANILEKRHLISVIEIRYEDHGPKQREWWFRCSTLSQDAFYELVRTLLTDAVPAQSLPASLLTEEAEEISRQHPHIVAPLKAGRRTTTLGEQNVSAFAPDMCFASVDQIICLLAGFACPGCGNVAGISLVGRTLSGIESLIKFSCNGCQRVSTYRPLTGQRGHYNKLAFVAAETSGPRGPINRFLETLFGATILTRSNGVDFQEKLADIVSLQANAELDLQCRYAAVCHREARVFAFDAAFERNARANNHALSLVLTITSAVTGNILHVYILHRKLLSSLRHLGTLCVPSEYKNGPDSTSNYQQGALEAMGLEIAVQQFTQRLAVAGAGGIEATREWSASDWDSNLLFAGQSICAVVIDALKAGPNIILRTLPECKIFIDWWHRRKTFSKALRKVSQQKALKGFSSLYDVLNDTWMDSMYNKTSFDEFSATAKDEAAKYEIDLENPIDDAHRSAWAKLEKKAKSILEEVDPQMCTSYNEMVHNHKNHYLPKGIKRSRVGFEIGIDMTILSWNNVPGWKEKAKDEFIKSFQ